jgi:hypothetical protein
MGGPFVMNTKAEIDQAFADLKGGNFLGKRIVSRARAGGNGITWEGILNYGQNRGSFA